MQTDIELREVTYWDQGWACNTQTKPGIHFLGLHSLWFTPYLCTLHASRPSLSRLVLYVFQDQIWGCLLRESSRNPWPGPGAPPWDHWHILCIFPSKLLSSWLTYDPATPLHPAPKLQAPPRQARVLLVLIHPQYSRCHSRSFSSFVECNHEDSRIRS